EILLAKIHWMKIPHIAKNPALSLVVVGCRLCGRPTTGVRQYCSYHRCFVSAQVCSPLVIEGLFGSFYTIDAFACLYNVEVHFRDPSFGPEDFDQQRTISFQPFSALIPSRP